MTSVLIGRQPQSLVGETVDHPIIRPSINAVAATYDLAVQNPELASELAETRGQLY